MKGNITAIVVLTKGNVNRHDDDNRFYLYINDGSSSLVSPTLKVMAFSILNPAIGSAASINMFLTVVIVVASGINSSDGILRDMLQYSMNTARKLKLAHSRLLPKQMIQYSIPSI